MNANMMRASVKAILAVAVCALFFARPNAAQASTFKVIHNFCSKFQCADGADPGAGLLMDSAGNLYGTTESGPDGPDSGVAYQLSLNVAKSKWVSTTLHRFCRGVCTNDGSDPRAELIIDSTGDLYGTTALGGPGNLGTVFELLPNGDRERRTLKLLHTFNDTDGNFPTAALSYDGAASGVAYDGLSPLYGTTEFGGRRLCGGGCGVVFSLTPNGGDWTESTVYEFCSLTDCRDGTFPAASVLVEDSSLFISTLDGNLKTATRGTILELTGHSATVLHVFCKAHRNCADGGSPGELTSDASGTLFGAGQFGGAHRKGCCGVVYKLVPSGKDSPYTVLHDFCDLRNCKDGAQPDSNILIDTSGNLYGATFNGGGHNSTSTGAGGGTVYKLTGTALETLHAFCEQRDCTDGQNPVGNIVMDGAGDIFGVTQAGGKFGHGVVFEISP